MFVVRATSNTWTQTLDPAPGPGPWKTWTQKNLDPEKPGLWKTRETVGFKKKVWDSAKKRLVSQSNIYDIGFPRKYLIVKAINC